MEWSSDELKCGPEELCFGGEAGAPGRQQPAWGISRPELICICGPGAGWAEAAGSRDPVPLGQKGIRRRSSRRGLNLEKTRLFSDLPRPSKSWPGKLRHSIDWAFTQNLFKTEFVHMWNGINTRDCVYGLLERWNFDEHLKVMSPVKKRQFNPVILLFPTSNFFPQFLSLCTNIFICFLFVFLPFWLLDIMSN